MHEKCYYTNSKKYCYTWAILQLSTKQHKPNHFLLILAGVNVNYYYVCFSPTPLLPYSTAQSNVEKFLRNAISGEQYSCRTCSVKADLIEARMGNLFLFVKKYQKIISSKI